MLQLIDALRHLPISSWQILFFLSAWTIIIFFLWTSWIAAKEGIDTVKRLHQIPCSDCRFFTGNYHLKCPVHPNNALTEEAINCSDYCPKGHKIIY